MITALLFFFLIDNDDRYLIPLFISRLHNQLTSLKMNMESIFTDKGKKTFALHLVYYFLHIRRKTWLPFYYYIGKESLYYSNIDMHLLVLPHITWTREGNWMVRPDPRHTKGATTGRDNSVSLRDASLVGRVVHCPRGWRDSGRRICYSAARCHPFYFSRALLLSFFFFLHSSQHQVPPWTRKSDGEDGRGSFLSIDWTDEAGQQRRRRKEVMGDDEKECIVRV